MAEKRRENIDMTDITFLHKIKVSQTYYRRCLNVCINVFVLWNNSYHTVEKYNSL